MEITLLVNLDHHRSRERIRELGEVFTPEQYVQQMLSLFDNKIWIDENVVFFEPSAGHGNIILPILAKRIEALIKKFNRMNEREPELCGIATGLNTLWAIDICPLNVDYCRKRVFGYLIHLLLENGIKLKSTKMKNFLAHALCTIIWQVHENETLSALSDKNFANQAASKTKLGYQWFKKNKHQPICFANDWCSNFKQQSKQNIRSILFERAIKFLDSTLFNGAIRGFDEFNFAKPALLDRANHITGQKTAGVV